MAAAPALAEIRRFAWRHRKHLPLLAVLPFVGVLVHEGSHALVARAFGAEITQWQLWPGDGAWGRVWIAWPPDVQRVPDLLLVSLAPVLTDLLLAGTTAFVAWRREHLGFAAASSLLLYGWCAPLADLANAASGWLLQGCTRCDLAAAFGAPGLAAWLGAAVLAWLALRGGHLLQRRLYGDRSLSPAAYAILATAALLIVVGGLPLLHRALSALGPLQ